MDTFQGWCKDGTEGTYDYRPLSALYMILRVGFIGEFLTVVGLSPGLTKIGYHWVLHILS